MLVSALPGKCEYVGPIQTLPMPQSNRQRHVCSPNRSDPLLCVRCLEPGVFNAQEVPSSSRMVFSISSLCSQRFALPSRILDGKAAAVTIIGMTQGDGGTESCA